MKKLLITLLILQVAVIANAQIFAPVKWSYSAQKTADKTYEIHITALIDNPWHIYSQDCGDGPVPTSFKFMPNPLLSLQGNVKEVGKMEQLFDPNFKSQLKYYEKQVDFVQKVKVKSAAATVIKGTTTFMICDNRQCLPPKDIPFTIKIGGK